MLVVFLRLVALLALAFTAFFGHFHGASAQAAEATQESLDFIGCYPVHQFEVCAEISGNRHQIVTSSGLIITGFTETSCFTVTLFGEFVSERCQTEHNVGMSEDGFVTKVHDSGYMEFTEGGQTCAGRFLLQIVNGETVIDVSDIECS